MARRFGVATLVGRVPIWPASSGPVRFVVIKFLFKRFLLFFVCKLDSAFFEIKNQHFLLSTEWSTNYATFEWFLKGPDQRISFMSGRHCRVWCPFMADRTAKVPTLVIIIAQSNCPEQSWTPLLTPLAQTHSWFPSGEIEDMLELSFPHISIFWLWTPPLSGLLEGGGKAQKSKMVNIHANGIWRYHTIFCVTEATLKYKQPLHRWASPLVEEVPSFISNAYFAHIFNLLQQLSGKRNKSAVSRVVAANSAKLNSRLQ